MSLKQQKLGGKSWIIKGILTSTRKKIHCFEHYGNRMEKNTSFGVTQTCLQKLNPCLKRFTITLNLLTTKKTYIKRGKLYVQ